MTVIGSGSSVERGGSTRTRPKRTAAASTRPTVAVIDMKRMARMTKMTKTKKPS